GRPLPADPGGDLLDLRPAGLQPARQDLRLGPDLLQEDRVQSRGHTSPPTSVRRTRSSASSTTRSAGSPAAIRPTLRSPSARAGVRVAISTTSRRPQPRPARTRT